jgi:predicted AAA+ superfamily ATPase
MIQRPEYLQWLQAAKDQHLIKIITGVRRCGKSKMFYLFQEELRNIGVADEQIIDINFEEGENQKKFTNWEILYDYVNARLSSGKKNYVFLDEVQNVPDFQRAADALFVKDNVDLYLTGSNSRMKAGEWATMFRGRYIELKMLPLSFKEYSGAYQWSASPDQQFEDYLMNSSFPQTATFTADGGWNHEMIKSYLDGLYESIIINDVADAKNIRERSKLRRVADFLFANIGNETSILNISNKIRSETKEISLHSATVENYIEGFLDAYIFYKATRHYIKGREHLESNAKYYAVDAGLRYNLLGRTGEDKGHILENVVYLELLRRGYQVHVGRVDTKEVDFVAISPKGITEYYQVCQTLLESGAEERELAPLNMIKDHFQKFLLTRDYDFTTHNGIQQINVLKWLLRRE